MTKDEALKLALEALEESHPEAYRHTITAIKEALAQPEQEPVAWKLVPVEPTDEMLKAMDECSTECYDERLYAGHAASVYMAAVDVAPTPPQRKPLTDEEIEDIWADCPADWDDKINVLTLARAIEAKLKEKNHG